MHEYLETEFTFLELTVLQWQNNIHDICANEMETCGKLKTFFEMQLDWMYSQIEHYPNDDYWHQVDEEKKPEWK